MSNNPTRLFVFFGIILVFIRNCDAGGHAAGHAGHASHSSHSSHPSGAGAVIARSSNGQTITGSLSRRSTATFSWYHGARGSPPRFSFPGSGSYRSYNVYHPSAAYSTYIAAYLWLGPTRSQARASGANYFQPDSCGMSVVACTDFLNISATLQPLCSDRHEYLMKHEDPNGAIVFSDVPLSISSGGGAESDSSAGLLTFDNDMDVSSTTSTSATYRVQQDSPSPFFASVAELELPVGNCSSLVSIYAPSNSPYFNATHASDLSSDVWLAVLLSTTGNASDGTAAVSTSVYMSTSNSSAPLLLASSPVLASNLSNDTALLRDEPDGTYLDLLVGISVMQVQDSAEDGVLAVYVGDHAVFDGNVSVSGFNWTAQSYTFAWSSRGCALAVIDAVRITNPFCVL